jgi:hypothetical protein
VEQGERAKSGANEGLVAVDTVGGRILIPFIIVHSLLSLSDLLHYKELAIIYYFNKFNYLLIPHKPLMYWSYSFMLARTANIFQTIWDGHE